MIFRQIVHEDLGCASYLVGDGKAGVAAVIDPKLEIEEYLAYARYVGVEIAHILETHNHADHVSGHGRLAAATGATIHINRIAEPDYEHEPFDDGWTLELGSVTITALHTPGHRPEHTAFVLTEHARGPEPWAVLTGDSLFVGDIARPDLAVDKREGAGGIFRSLQEKLLTLPRECEVWPGHLGGSLCGGPGMDMKPSSTIGYERNHSRLLAISNETEFVDTMIAALGPQPPNFRNIVALNRGPLITGESGSPAPRLTPLQVERKLGEGALIIDVRPEGEFDRGHIPGALCNPVIRAGFGTKLGWIVDPDREVVLVGRDDGDAMDAAGLAAAVGIRNIAGMLAGGMTGWSREQRPVASVETLSLAGLAARFDEFLVLDVRELSEWEEGRVPGSVHIPYHDLAQPPTDLDLDLTGRPLALICSSGQRAAVGTSLLLHHGAREVLRVIDGGVPAWEEQGRPIERPEPDRPVAARP